MSNLATIISIEADMRGTQQHSWNSRNGLTYGYKATVKDTANGEELFGELGSKSPETHPLAVGTKVEYIFTPNRKNPAWTGSLQLKKAQDQGGSAPANHSTQQDQQAQPKYTNNTVGIEVGHAINCACAIYSGHADVQLENIEILAWDIIKMADKMKAERETAQTPVAKPLMSKTDPIFNKALKMIQDGKNTILEIEEQYDFTEEVRTILQATQDVVDNPVTLDDDDSDSDLPF